MAVLITSDVPLTFFVMKHALLALSLAAALAGGACASPSSFVGMGTNTGTPSGDVRALQDHVPPEFLKTTNDLVRDEDVEAVRPDFAERAVRPFRIVVQSEVASDPSSRFLRVTKEFLGKLFGYQTFSVYYLDSADLGRAVQDGLADFIIAEPTFFTAEGPMMNVDVIASMRSGEAGSADESQGSVIFTKKRSGAPVRQPSYLKKDRHDEYADLLSLRYESFAATSDESLGGWLAAAGVFAKAGVTREELQLRTEFLGLGAYEKVLERVLKGESTVGILPACSLEQLERAGKLNIGRDIEIVHPLPTTNFACSVSTPLYPGWALGATERTSIVFRDTILSAFRAVKAPGLHDAWTDPAEARSVYDLYYLLKIGPYRDLADWSFRRILREHGDLIAFLSLVTFLVLSYAVSLSVLVRRKTRELRASLEARELIEAEASQSRAHIANLERTGLVGQMSTIIAHELKQPLGAIMNYANGLMRRTKRGAMDQEKFLEALGEIVAQAERASRIVERVRGYAKHDYPPRKVADLSVVIDRAIQTFRRSRTTTASLQIAVPRNSMAEVDEWEIELALLNLLKNAADAISGVPDPMIRVSLSSKEGNWILSVADNGPEVSDEAISNFFKPLRTSKGEGGMGLGLSIVANIAERHAGRVTVRKNGKRGVTFDFVLPKTGETEPDAPREERIEVLDRRREVEAMVKSAEAEKTDPGVSGPATSEAAVSVIERMTTVDREKRGSIPVTVQSLGLAEALHFYESGDIGRKEDVRKNFLSAKTGVQGLTLVSPYDLRRGETGVGLGDPKTDAAEPGSETAGEEKSSREEASKGKMPAGSHKKK